MKEQLHATEKRSFGAKSIKLAKETLRHPLTYGVVCLSMISWAGVDVATAPNKIDRQLDEAFPLTASTETVKEAKNELLVFDREVRKRVISEQTKIEVAEFSKQPQIAQAITIVNQQEQRDNLKETLDSRAFARQSTKGLVAIFVLCASGLVAFALNRRQQINETGPKGTTNA